MLAPLILTSEELEEFESQALGEEIEPSKTYKFDILTGEISAEFVDDNEALKQAVVKYLTTIRDNYLVYTTDYGSELTYLLGQNFSQEYLDLEVPRLIEEALMVDDRIDSVEDVIVEKDGDSLNISFSVISKLGDVIPVEVGV